MTNRPGFLAGGGPARLIPITAVSAREQKSVSVILAGLRSVLELRQSLLKSLNVRVGISATFEVVYEVDLAGKFSGRKVFVEELEKAVPHFYQEAGQWLKAWTPPPPKIPKAGSELKTQGEETVLEK